jgi:hypothetical protein
VSDINDGTPNGEAILPADAIQCSKEYEVCTLPEGISATIWYGAKRSWYSRSALSGSVACSNGVFGDPRKGTRKACYYKAD